MDNSPDTGTAEDGYHQVSQKLCPRAQKVESAVRLSFTMTWRYIIWLRDMIRLRDIIRLGDMIRLGDSDAVNLSFHFVPGICVRRRGRTLGKGGLGVSYWT